jgi:hypothetical protein
MSVVLSFLGISAFAKDKEGKSFLLPEQEKMLKDKYGDKFLESFKKDLADFERDGAAAETAVTEEVTAQLQAEQADNARLLARIKALEEAERQFKADIEAKEKEIEKLSKEPGNGAGEVRTEETGQEQMAHRFKPDMSLAHNQWLDAAFKGAVYSGNTTIDTTELQREFGKYVSSERLQILRDLMGTTESIRYMSTIVTDKTEVRAMQSAIDSVLQQFVPYWTPKSKSTFTPLTIKNFKCKINVQIKPSDIMEDILGYLYDENLDPKDMPIVRYILYQLIFPKLAEEREQALAVGVYKENSVSQDGGTASAALDCMDGYVTQLKALKTAENDKVTWLLDGTALSTDGETLLSQIDQAVDQVKPLYRNKTMFVHADPDLVIKYSRAYREKYPWLKNQDGEKVKIDFTNFTFAPLEGMRGTGVFFITPKENFKHLMSKDPQRTSIRMETNHYNVDIMAEWWEACGFWLAEAIFAYIPPEEEAESSQGGGV